MKSLKILSLILAAVTILTVALPVVADPKRPAITLAVDDAKWVRLRGNIPPIVASKHDLGTVDNSVPTGALFVLLGRSSSEQRAYDNYVLSLSTPGSGAYHKWLTPAQFAEQFGANSKDIATVTNWLQGQGFTVVKVNNAMTAIEFSGTMGSVKTAFKTDVHKFNIDGAGYFVNISDPQIPAAFAPIIRGIIGLNRAIPGSQVRARQPGQQAFATAKPALSTGRSTIPELLLTAGDAAAIYDTPNASLNPAYTGTTVDGTGVTIGAVELSNLTTTNLQDFVQYRATFLNNTVTQANAFIPSIVLEGTDPGVNNNFSGSFEDEKNTPATQAIADGQISQALAPGSKTILYVAQTMEQALVRAVDDNNVSILLVNTIDDCERNLGAATNAFLNDEYEQAAAQGITVVAATGDYGSSGCVVNDSTTSAGLEVNGGASTPWNVAVGGTEFQVLGTIPSQYFNTGTSGQASVGLPPYFITALSYIPESSLNDTTWANMTTFENNSSSSNAYAGATGGGPSSQAVCSGSVTGQVGITGSTCSGELSGYLKPPWQTSLTPNDGVRDVPDIALFAGSGSPGFNSSGNDEVAAQAFWATCIDSTLVNGWPNCNSSDPGATAGSDGGTASASAAVAGIFALVEQSRGQRLGLVTPTLYRLASVVPSVFHDITTGNNSIPCTTGSASCGSNNFLDGYNADIGYDLATGLGSLDVAKLVANWSNAGMGQATVTLTAGTTASSLGSGPILVTHGTTVYFDAAVVPNTATGNVAFINSSRAQDGGALPLVVLTNGNASFSSPALPGGSYAVQASYGGDSNDIDTESNSISVTVDPEPSTLGMILQSFDPSTGTVTNGAASVPYGMELALAITPYGSAGEGKGTIPTGTVSAADGSTSFGSAPLNIVGTSNGGPGTAYIGYFNSTPLSPGSDAIAVTYSGDSSYKATSTSLGLTVTKAAVTVTAGVGITGGCTTLKSDWSMHATCVAQAGVNTDSVGSAPTGNIAISFNGTTQNLPLTPGAGLGTSTGINVVNSIAQTSAIDVTSYVGTYLPTVSAVYGGDLNYQSASGTSSTVHTDEWVVSEPTGASFALSTSGAISVAAGGQGSSAVTVTPAGGFLGQVALTCTVSGGTGVNEPTCSIPATSAMTSSSSQTVALTLGTTPATAGARTLIGGRTGLLGLGGLFLCGLLIRRRRIAGGLYILVLSASLIASVLLGCGSGSSGGGGGGGGGNSGTPAGTYTVTITGANPNVTYSNGWVSNPITASTTVTATVN